MINKFWKQITEGEGRIIVGNFIALSILKVVGFIFPMITLPYLSKVIGVSKFGELAFAASVITFAETVVNYGFNYTATREVAKNKLDIIYVSKVFSLVIVTKLILTIFSFILLVLVIQFFPLFYQYRLILLLSFTYIFGNILFPEWLFQALEKMKYITILSVISKFIFAMLIFIIIKEEDDYIYYPVLLTSGMILSGIISLFIINIKFKIKFILPSLDEIQKVIVSNFNIFISLFLPNLYTNFSIIFLSKIHGSFETGIYSGGYRFVSLFDEMMQVLTRTFYPFLARRMDKQSVFVKLGLIFSLVSSIVLFFSADFIVKIFYTNDFFAASQIIKIMAICPFFLFLINTYGSNYLVLVGKERELRNIVLICSIIGLIFTSYFTYFYGAIGVAITLTITWGIRGLMTWQSARKHKAILDKSN